MTHDTTCHLLMPQLIDNDKSPQLISKTPTDQETTHKWRHTLWQFACKQGSSNVPQKKQN